MDPRNFPKAKRKIMNGIATADGFEGDYSNDLVDDQVSGSCMNGGGGPTLGLAGRDSLSSTEKREQWFRMK